MATTTNNIENFDIIEELANLGALIDVDGILIDVKTYIEFNVEDEVE